jgi:hypothetical protein
VASDFTEKFSIIDFGEKTSSSVKMESGKPDLFPGSALYNNPKEKRNTSRDLTGLVFHQKTEQHRITVARSSLDTMNAEMVTLH